MGDFKVIEKEVIVPRGGIVCGQSEAEERVFKMVHGKRNMWFISTDVNSADNVYTVSPGSKGGFGGRPLKMKLTTGEIFETPGGSTWHSNTESLLQDTGIDIRDRFLTQCIISKDKRYEDSDTFMVDVLYMDNEPVLGEFERGRKIATEIATALGHAVICHSTGTGGASTVHINPE